MSKQAFTCWPCTNTVHQPRHVQHLHLCTYTAQSCLCAHRHIHTNTRSTDKSFVITQWSLLHLPQEQLLPTLTLPASEARDCRSSLTLTAGLRSPAALPWSPYPDSCEALGGAWHCRSWASSVAWTDCQRDSWTTCPERIPYAALPFTLASSLCLHVQLSHLCTLLCRV